MLVNKKTDSVSSNAPKVFGPLAKIAQRNDATGIGVRAFLKSVGSRSVSTMQKLDDGFYLEICDGYLAKMENVTRWKTSSPRTQENTHVGRANNR